jgi:hypothetical protein
MRKYWKKRSRFQQSSRAIRVDRKVQEHHREKEFFQPVVFDGLE